MLPCNVWEIWVHWFTHISITLTMFYNLNDINPVLNCYWNSRETDPRRWAVVLQLQKTTVKKLICRWDSIDSVPPSKIKVGRFFSATLLRILLAWHWSKFKVLSLQSYFQPLVSVHRKFSLLTRVFGMFWWRAYTRRKGSHDQVHKQNSYVTHSSPWILLIFFDNETDLHQR